MSKSVRLSDELVERAKVQSAKFHRSAAQQIEHWAALGQLMEPALSFPVQEKAGELTRQRLDGILENTHTSEAIAKAQAVIRSTTAEIASRDQ